MTNKTKQFFIVGLIIALFTLGLVGFLYNKLQNKITNLDNTILSLTAQNAKEAAQVKLSRLVKDTEEDRAIINSFFFANEGDGVSFISSVEALATGVGLTGRTESIEKTTDPVTKSEMIKMVFRVSGEKERVISFVRLMESVPYHSRVENLDLRQVVGSDWEAKITMFVTIKSL